MGVHEVLPSNTLILHLAFFIFLPPSLSFFTVTQKFILTYFTVNLLMSH